MAQLYFFIHIQYNITQRGVQCSLVNVVLRTIPPHSELIIRWAVNKDIHKQTISAVVPLSRDHP